MFGGHAARLGGGYVHRGFSWRNPEGRRLLGRPRHRWEVNIKMDESFIYSPTDSIVSCLKTILKFTLKQLRHVSAL